MDYSRTQPITCETYETCDPISNLRFSVSLRKVRRAAEVTVQERNTPGETSQLDPAALRAKNEKGQFEVTLSWQQKILGARHEADEAEELQQGPEGGAPPEQRRDRPRDRTPIFTYIDSDDFTRVAALAESPTTSGPPSYVAEQLRYGLRGWHGVVKFQSMYVMLDTAEDEKDPSEEILCCIRAFTDGTFEMTPGFSRPGAWYRIESKHGTLYEFRVTNVSRAEPSEVQRRQEQLEADLVDRARRIKKSQMGGRFQAPPGDERGAAQVALMLEIVSATGFDGESLYVNYELRHDEEAWAAVSDPGEAPPPACGSTQVSRACAYPPDPLSCDPAPRVAHFATPVEAVLQSRGLVPQSRWPVLYLHVCSLDSYGRYRTEGYAHLPLTQALEGSHDMRLRTWRPWPTPRQRLEEFFIGGSLELEDMSSVGIPSTFRGTFLSKFGFKTESSGTVRVRVNMAVQQKRKADKRQMRLQQAVAQASQPLVVTAARAKINEVVERARRRLELARGGPAGVPEEIISELVRRKFDPPKIYGHPHPWVGAEGEQAVLEVQAYGRKPLLYQWFLNGQRLEGAEGPRLTIAAVRLRDVGVYHCRVANADGSTSSRQANVRLRRPGEDDIDDWLARARAAGRAMPEASHPLRGASKGPLAMELAVEAALGSMASGSLQPLPPLSAALGGDDRRASTSMSGAPPPGSSPLAAALAATSQPASRPLPPLPGSGPGPAPLAVAAATLLPAASMAMPGSPLPRPHSALGLAPGVSASIAGSRPDSPARGGPLSLAAAPSRPASASGGGGTSALAAALARER